MADLSAMSDQDLLALRGAAVPAAPVASPLAGMSDADLLALRGPSALDTAKDVGKSAGIGLVKGGIGMLGMPGDLRTLASAGTSWLGNKAGISPETVQDLKDNVYNAVSVNPMLRPLTNPGSAEIQKQVEGQTGEFYKPKTVYGEYAQTAGEFAPAAAAGPGGLVRRLGMQVAAPAIASETAGQATKGTKAEPYARLAGAFTPATAVAAARRLITPFASSPERQRLVGILENEGVDSLTAGQRTGNKTLQYAESILGDAPGAGQSASGVQQQGQRQFTEAAMRRAGAGPEATPEILAQNNARLGNQFEQLSARNNLTPDNQFITDLTQAVGSYRRVPDSQQRAMVQGYVDDIIQHVNAGSMPGPQYQEMRARMSRQAQSLRNSDPTLSEALRDMRNALDNAMGRSISPADREAWQAARREYGAQKTLEKSASRAGEATAEGQITPANLRNTVAANNRGSYARGEGDFSELARAGAGVMAPLPNSGTGQRVAINSLTTGLGATLGGLSTGGLGTVAGAAAGAAAPALAGRALMSRPMQAYLGNQLIGAAPEDAQRIARLLLRTELGSRPLIESQPSR